ncbi:MAG: hypothetical protein AAGD11_04785 [Planctomycetota bacterium]
MTTLTSNSATTSNTSDALLGSKFSLSVAQPGQDDRIVDLAPGKSTVGSSERCQVRIIDHEAQPLHCLVVQDGATVSVTRWATGVLLNGEHFATASFEPGDCLQIGQVKMSLVAKDLAPKQADSASVEPPVASPIPTPRHDPSAAALPSFAFPSPAVSNRAAVSRSNYGADATTVDKAVVASTERAEESTVLVANLKSAKENARARCRRLVTVLRSMREEANDFETRVDDLQKQLTEALAERQQIFSQLSQLQSEAKQREQQSAHEVDRLIAELTAAYEKASLAEAATEDAGRASAELQTGLEQQVAEAREKAAEAADALAALESQSLAVQSELAELREQQQQWEQLRNSGELQRTKLAQVVAERERSVETLQTELEQFRQAADQADESRMEQASAMQSLHAELESLQAEREQLAIDLAAARQYEGELERSIADSEQNLAVFQLELEKFQLTSRQTDQELAEKATTLEDIQSEFTQIKEERDQLVVKRTEYQLREQGWEHEIASRDSKIEELSKEVSQLRQSVEDAVQGAASQASQVDETKQQYDALIAERDQLLLAQDEQLNSVRAWEEAVESRDRRIAELEQEHEGICEVLQSVEKGAFEQVDACNKLQDQLAMLREERDQFANALPEQREYITQLEHTLSERDTQITLLSEELTKTTERQTALELQLAEGTSAYETLEAEMQELGTRCDQLLAEQTSSGEHKLAGEQTLKQQEQQIQDLMKQVELQERSNQELEQIVATGSQSSESVQSELASLRSRYEQLEVDYHAELDRRQELDTQLAERDQNLELFQVDVRSVQAELDRTVSQVADLQSERDTLNRQLTGLREELAASEHTAIASDATQPNTQPEAEPSGAEAAYDNLASALADSLDDEPGSTADFHDAYSSDDAYDVADEYGYSAESAFASEDGEDSGEADRLADVAADQPPNPDDQISADSANAFAAQQQQSDAELEAATGDSDPDLVANEELPSELEPGADAGELNQDESESERDLILEAEPEAPSTSAFDKPEPTREERNEEFKPTSFIDQYQHLLEDDGTQDSLTLQPTQEPQENRLGAEIDAMAASAEDDSDEALEAYMQNMLRRMRGDSEDDQASAPQASEHVQLNQNPNPVSAVTDVLQNVAPPVEPHTPEPESVEPIDLESLKRTSQKPELPTDLAAMRELANTSARKAIAKHHKRRHLEKAAGLFLVCLIAICVGAYMLLTGIAAQDFLGLNVLGGSIAVVIGAFGGLKLLKLLLLAIREGSWERGTTAKSKVAQSVSPSDDSAAAIG